MLSKLRDSPGHNKGKGLLDTHFGGHDVNLNHCTILVHHFCLDYTLDIIAMVVTGLCTVLYCTEYPHTEINASESTH